MAKGASVAREGLAVPPRREPATSALASRPSPADVLGPGEFLLFCSTHWFVFLVFYSKVCFGFVQVLLILRSQVGLMPCAKFIPWSEVRFFGLRQLVLGPYDFFSLLVSALQIVSVRSSVAWTLTRYSACNLSTIALYVYDVLYLPSQFFARRFVVTFYF